ncbi:hypothetical protein BV25DRAFT_1815707, partial [Artomyces pyxidatus]
MPASHPTVVVDPPESHGQIPRDHASHLRVVLSPEYTDRFKRGYADDPYFREKWSAATEQENKPYAGQCFLRGDSGLLFFRINNEPTRLCVPRAETRALIARTHDSAFEAAHEG